MSTQITCSYRWNTMFTSKQNEEQDRLVIYRQIFSSKKVINLII